MFKNKKVSVIIVSINQLLIDSNIDDLYTQHKMDWITLLLSDIS